MRGAIFVLWLTALLATFTYACSGCATMQQTGKILETATKVGMDLAECAKSEYDAVRDAITTGQPDWLDIVLSLWPCVPAVVRDISTASATAVTQRLPPLLSKEARARAAASLVLGVLIHRNVSTSR